MSKSKSVESPLTTSHAKALTESALRPKIGERFNVVGADPNRVYRWIHFSKFKDSGFSDFRGWTPLVANNLTTEKPPSSESYGIKGDGFFHNRDTILAWMPKELNEEIKAEKKLKDGNRLASVNNTANRLARNLGSDLNSQSSIEVKKGGHKEVY